MTDQQQGVLSARHDQGQQIEYEGGLPCVAFTLKTIMGSPLRKERTT